MTDWRRPSYVAVVDQPPEDGGKGVVGGVLYLGPLPEGPVVVLEGVAAVIYRAATSDHETDLVELIAAGLGVDPEEVDAQEVEAFLTELAERRLLEPASVE